MRTRARTWYALLLIPFFQTHCAPQFVGASKVPEGASGCLVRCSDEGLDFVGMVFMGEYTDGCICATRKAASSEAVRSGAAGAAAAAAAVAMPLRRDE